ncbi:MAG: zf-HC2 domain-containing protein [Candidatus Eisenbacteria bacterium]|nr:zf-HC2 domain-containing protein [Candidatus Eisenbacteria bacterium]
MTITPAHDPWTDRLSEYVDGEMRPVDREALEHHLAGCPACSVALAELRSVVARAHALEDRAPADDLWPGIATAIAATPRRAPVARPPADWWRRRLDLTLPQLAAAALVVAALSAGTMWIALARSPLRAPAPGATAPVASSPAAASQQTAPAPASPTAVTAATADVVNPRYDRAVAELEQALADGRGRLDPRTLQVLEQNLRTIDRAIGEARRAVAADPANAWLRSHLATTMKRKVDLLRTAAMLTAGRG